MKPDRAPANLLFEIQSCSAGHEDTSPGKVLLPWAGGALKIIPLKREHPF
jgi:hypothetical protein